MTERLELVATLKENISAGAKKAGKALETIRPSHGMAAAQKWMETFRKGSDQTVAALRPVTGMMNSVGVGGLAASLSIGEMVKQFKELADSTLTLKEISRQSRITEDDLRRLRYAGERFHLNPDAVNGAINSWSAQMVGFRMHTSKFYNELALMNADVAKKIASESPIQAFKDTADYIARIRDPQVRKMWADDAGMGEILPMLNRGPDGLASIFADAARAVKPMSQEMKDAAERFNTSVTNLKQTWDNLENDLGPNVLDPLTTAIGKLDDVVKIAAASPGDAAAGAAIIAGSFAGFWARARIMRGSALAGGGGAMGRAAGEMQGAASQQIKATATFAEAVAEFRLGVAQMRGGALPGGAGPVEPTKPGLPETVENAPKGFLGKGGLKGVGGSIMEGVVGAMIYQAGEQAMDAILGWTSKDQKTLDRATSPSNVWNDVREQWFGGGGAGGGASSLYRAYDGQGGTQPTSTLSPDAYWARKRAYLGMPSGSHPDDDRLSRARASDMTAHEMFKTVRDGSKEGIVQGLREMAQQQELAGGPGSGFGEGAGDRGHGLSNIRYGRSSASGAYRRTLGDKYDLNDGGTGSHAPITGRLFAQKAPGVAARLKQDFPGLSDEDAAAVLGNLGHESGGFTQFEEDHGRGPGRGWAQWTDPGRKARFFQYAKEHNLDPKSDDASYGFLRWELTHTHKAAMDALKHAQGLRAKTRAFEQIFEGAGVKNYPSRDRYADGALAAIRRAATAGAGTPAPSASAVSDAERMAAQQRIINGSRDPKDRALIDRYKAQQAQPQAHRSGGWIRGRGTGTSDSIPAWLSNGEFVVNAKASGQWLPFLHAINSGHMYAAGGSVGFGVDQRFYPKFTPGISAEQGRSNRRSWLSFFQRRGGDGGMGASRSVALGATAMMNGETGWGLNSNTYGWDVNGPSGGAAQWHDVTTGRWAGKLHRLTDLMTFAAAQHADWHDTGVQQAFWKKEATSSLSGAWHAMRLAKMAAGTLRQGINLFENPADHAGELRKRMPNIARLAREDGGGRVAGIDPVQIDIRHHPHSGKSIIQARGGRGSKLSIKTMPTMRPS